MSLHFRLLPRHRFYSSSLLLGALFAVVIGCGPDYKARAVVKGKVTMGKQPLTAGTVTFFGPYNITTTAQIEEDGSYVMNDAPIGEVKVTVKVNAPPGGVGPGGKGGMPAWAKIAGADESKDPSGGGGAIPVLGKIPKKIVRIPDKFEKTETSGLTYKVEAGEHVYNIELFSSG
jgi:hypothetical protein